jgi:hypothetical protein
MAHGGVKVIFGLRRHVLLDHDLFTHHLTSKEQCRLTGASPTPGFSNEPVVNSSLPVSPKSALSSKTQFAGS